jgi:hypothetical protein
VKAFDTVPRVALSSVLRRYLLPNHFLNVIMRLYKNAKIKVKIGSVDSEVEISIGVRHATWLRLVSVHNAGNVINGVMASTETKIPHL